MVLVFWSGFKLDVSDILNRNGVHDTELLSQCICLETDVVDDFIEAFFSPSKWKSQCCSYW
jgi:hypothetical protein